MAPIELTRLIPWILTIGGLLSGAALATGQGLLSALPVIPALIGCIAVRSAENRTDGTRLTKGYRC